MKRFALAVFFIAAAVTHAQPMTQRYAAYGDVIVTQLSTAPFPHPLRANGHIYNGIPYSAEEHYRDSSVVLFVRKGYRRPKTVDLVLYFQDRKSTRLNSSH